MPNITNIILRPLACGSASIGGVGIGGPALFGSTGPSEVKTFGEAGVVDGGVLSTPDKISSAVPPSDGSVLGDELGEVESVGGLSAGGGGGGVKPPDDGDEGAGGGGTGEAGGVGCFESAGGGGGGGLGIAASVEGGVGVGVLGGPGINGLAEPGD
ncbi:MAG: hypothetical protein COT81_01120 [Candidatus Buchananbacteria bacterium CG10_big_fil_rev_8_21_14_0_10_42_9]|uniref:Uncharacterized protein n=1 Tax=Candidatus Buchananbacteria bacterium CG10_big_fil_rev_8_21_14_0_10_42_9 TaxID=1974526 RepID=A0A2H0W1Z1_9BACT|nr:MAG: hypothetical protein COT81_01120 [Candidatus Buchananbacteria bacterium CG10_big_fil_rev_8_21_14_0_10_42_9]